VMVAVPVRFVKPERDCVPQTRSKVDRARWIPSAPRSLAPAGSQRRAPERPLSRTRGSRTLPRLAAADARGATNELGRFLAHVSGDRLRALWRLAATTGMRRGELLGLTWLALDLGDAPRRSATRPDSRRRQLRAAKVEALAAEDRARRPDGGSPTGALLGTAARALVRGGRLRRQGSGVRR
jgi:integrase